MKLDVLVFVTAAAAAPSGGISSLIGSLSSSLLSSGVSTVMLNPFTPGIVKTYLLPLQISLERSMYITRKGSELQLAGKRWTASGGNVYWLGLDENVIPPVGEPFYAPLNASYPTKGRITEIMNTLNTMGATAFRCHTCGAFDTIDWTVYQARQHGLRLFAPLTDNYDYYHGGKYNFLRWRGINITGDSSPYDPRVMEFYTNREIINDFKTYIKTLLTHVNPYTGLTYAEDPTIFAYESGNELSGAIFRDMDVPVEWTNEIGAYIKQLAPKKLFVDGTYGINKTHLSIPSVDILSDHFYPLNNTLLSEDIALVGSVNKVYFAGEYAWTEAGATDSLASFLNLIESQQSKSNPVVAGDHFWSLFMHDVPDCSIYVNHSDGFTLQYGNPANSAETTSLISTIRDHLFALKGQTVDSPTAIAACPGPLADYLYS